MVLQIGTAGFIGELASCPWPGRVPNTEMRTPFAFPWKRNLRTEGSFQTRNAYTYFLQYQRDISQCAKPCPPAL